MKGTEIAKLITRVVSKVAEEVLEMIESIGGEKKWKMCRKNREVFGRW